MMKRMKLPFGVVILCVALMMSANAQPPDAPQPAAEGAFFTGEYRNMLAEYGLTDAEIQARIDADFQQLFYGNEHTERVYYPVGDDMAYIEDIANADIRSEGMSYGMMITVQLDKQAEFDRLWTWARTYMYQEGPPFEGYFCWHARRDGSCIDSNPASDGEIWFITALFFADARWGSRDGIYDYRAEANNILHTLLHTDDTDTPMASNLFDAETKLVVFVPQLGPNRTFTDPSYMAPHFYELWALWADKDNDFYIEAAEAARQLWRDAAHPETGLMANYTEWDGTPRGAVTSYGGVFYADAWRIGLMIAMDYSWFAADEWQVGEIDRLQSFFHNLGIGAYNSQFEIDGTPANQQHRSSGLIAANAAASLAASQPQAWDFITEFWEMPLATGQYRYYDGLLQMMSLLQLSGNFRIYAPED